MSQKPKAFSGVRPLHVFLSWSGTRSRALAEVLRDWLPKVIQAVQPWMSQYDLEKGEEWFSELNRNLELAHIGILCLTPENMNLPWVLFEAGALFQRPLCPVLLDLEAGTIPDPLMHYQATQLNPEDIYRLLLTCNRVLRNLGVLALSEGQLRDSFKAWWPELAEKIEAISKMSREAPVDDSEKESSVRKMLEKMDMIFGFLSKSPPRASEPRADLPQEAITMKHFIELGERVAGSGILGPETSWRLTEVLLLIRDERVDLRNEFENLLEHHKA